MICKPTTLSAAVLLATASLAHPVVVPDGAETDRDCGSSSNNSSSQHFLKMTAQKLRGSTFQNAVIGAEPYFLEKRDSSGDGYVSVELLNENTFYLTEIEVGNPVQKVGVLVDTGSSDLWVVATNNTYCESGTGGPLTSKARAVNDIFDRSKASAADSVAAVNGTTEDAVDVASIEELQNKASSSGSGTSINCSTYGTFDPADSETFHSNNTAFSITYADGTFAKGTWGYDDVILNGANVTNLSLAVCDNADNAMGILGIGLSGLETTYSGSSSVSGSSSSSYKYENLPLKLKSLGLIEQVAYSVYLNDSSADSANILFGAVDHNKYTGDMYALPIVNTLESKRYDEALELDITLNSVTLVDKSSSTQANVGSGAAAALLDTGTTLTYVPQNVLSAILSNIDAQYSSSTGYYVMKCSAADDLYLVFNFQGLDITIDFSSFLVSLVTTTGSSSEYCMVGLQSSDTATFTLGDSFLRNVYMVADLDNLEIGLAIANHDSNDEDIEVLSEGIPSAVTPATSLTWGAQSTTLAVQSNVQMSSVPSSQVTYNFSSTTSSSATATKKDNNVTTTKTSSNSTTTSLSTSTSTVSSISSTNSRNAANSTGFNSIYGLAGSLLLFVTALL